MKILTVENKTYDINCVPDEIDDIRYCVLDASDPVCRFLLSAFNLFRELPCSCYMFTNRR